MQQQPQVGGLHILRRRRRATPPATGVELEPAWEAVQLQRVHCADDVERSHAFARDVEVAHVSQKSRQSSGYTIMFNSHRFIKKAKLMKNMLS